MWERQAATFGASVDFERLIDGPSSRASSSVILRKVTYALFLSDAAALVELNLDRDHEIDREICLTFDDGTLRFVSWCAAHHDAKLLCAGMPAYCVGVAEAPYFLGPTQLLADVSDSSFWSPLIGIDAPLEFDRDDHQLLRIGVGPSAVFAASYEREWWGMDTLRISKSPPDPRGRLDEVLWTALNQRRTE
jgi:hypothetical protein